MLVVHAMTLEHIGGIDPLLSPLSQVLFPGFANWFSSDCFELNFLVKTQRRLFFIVLTVDISAELQVAKLLLWIQVLEAQGHFVNKAVQLGWRFFKNIKNYTPSHHKHVSLTCKRTSVDYLIKNDGQKKKPQHKKSSQWKQGNKKDTKMKSSDEQCSLSTQTCRVTKSTTSHFNWVGRGAPEWGGRSGGSLKIAPLIFICLQIKIYQKQLIEEL